MIRITCSARSPALMTSVFAVASPASTNPAMSLRLKPCASSKLSVEPSGESASLASARRAAELSLEFYWYSPKFWPVSAISVYEFRRVRLGTGCKCGPDRGLGRVVRDRCHLAVLTVHHPSPARIKDSCARQFCFLIAQLCDARKQTCAALAPQATTILSLDLTTAPTALHTCSHNAGHWP